MSLRLPIYLDHNATTPVDPRVLETMLPHFTQSFGNAASRTHAFGWRAEAVVNEARERIAAALGARAQEIVFTSGATESDNLAILGAARAYRSKGDHVVTSMAEHNAVLDPCHELAREGFRVTLLQPDRFGRTSAASVEAALTEKTILVSVMAANNEIGTLNPIQEIGRLCKARGVLFHTDAVQAFTKVPIDVDAMSLDLVSITAHKIYGPKGVGALYVRSSNPRVRLQPVLFGGGHEKGLRSGTLNVPGIVGFASAARIALEARDVENERLLALRERLHGALVSRLAGVTLNGPPDGRLAGNLNLSFSGVDAESLLMAIRDLAVSTGSACTSASLEPSHVLKAIGVTDDLAHASIRFGLGRYTTRAEIDFAIETVVSAVERLREERLARVRGGADAPP